MHFRHDAGKDVHAPGFYLHLQPGECFAGVGLWHPEPKVAAAVRERIAEDPTSWKKAAHAKPLRESWTPMGESLVRPPKGVAADHPFVDDTRRKDFVMSRRLSESEILSPRFLDDFTALCKQATPYMRYLCESVGVPF